MGRALSELTGGGFWVNSPEKLIFSKNSRIS
jgi:hypothetical protein